MDLNLTNYVALVTGASQGIGKEIALQLAKEGAQLAITSNDQIALEQVADEIRNFGQEALAISGDAAVENDILAIVNSVISHFGQINILINNVGKIGCINTFEDISAKQWHELFSLNVMIGVNFTRAILPQMRKNHWGRIIFISSEKAIEPGMYMPHYAMTKAALLSISKSLANELGKDGITVNSISPGVILTPSWDEDAKKSNLTREAYAAQFCHNVLPGQPLGNPRDVANLVCYLCSEQARWITGSNFRIDGGSISSV